MLDLFILAAEPSADLYGALLIKELLQLRPNLKIAAVAGPQMRSLPIKTLFPMENLQVMGFLDVIIALPKLIHQFFTIRNKILQLSPRAFVSIDYPGFNLQLTRSLKKKGFEGKLIHYICPTVWAWKKKRIPHMAETLDLLLTLFPFEKKCFVETKLHVEYVGHPLVSKISFHSRSAIKPDSLEQGLSSSEKKILALFPGSRETEIRRNFPIQLRVAKKLLALDPTLEIAVSNIHQNYIPLLTSDIPLTHYPAGENYILMQKAYAAIATSGTVTLELALHNVPTVVNFAIRSLDLFIAQRIFRINLPFYCIVNIVLSRQIFPELFGPNLTEERLFFSIHKLWTNEAIRAEIQNGCAALRTALGKKNASLEAAGAVLSQFL